MSSGWFLRLVIVGLFLAWMASFFIGFAFLERVPYRAAIPLYQIGNTWLIAFLYLALAFIILDILSLCHLLPKGFLKESWTMLGAIAGAVTLLLFAGGIHYHNKHREELTLETSKPLEKPLTVVLASDLHLGYHNRKAELGRWIDLVNAENPDLVLIGGDIIDRSLRPVIRDNYASEFQRLSAPIWTVLGNHEYYSDVEGSEKFFKDAGISLLKDSYIDTLGIRVVGRNDRSFPCRPAFLQVAFIFSGIGLVLPYQFTADLSLAGWQVQPAVPDPLHKKKPSDPHKHNSCKDNTCPFSFAFRII